jgi:Cu(I)/Ag(I) efflux system periplasmic protein CusF
MKKALLFALAALLAGAASAQEMTAGEVRKVDRKAAKITLKHERIENLSMKPMTMDFAVKDRALLQGVKRGDKVRFSAEKTGDDEFTVTRIEAAR